MYNHLRRPVPKESVKHFQYLLAKLEPLYPAKTEMMLDTRLNERQIKNINDGIVTYLNGKKIVEAYQNKTQAVN